MIALKTVCFHEKMYVPLLEGSVILLFFWLVPPRLISFDRWNYTILKNAAKTYLMTILMPFWITLDLHHIEVKVFWPRPSKISLSPRRCSIFVQERRISEMIRPRVNGYPWMQPKARSQCLLVRLVHPNRGNLVVSLLMGLIQRLVIWPKQLLINN